MKLIDREPTQEMLKAIASSDCAPSNYKQMFQSAYDAAPDVKQEPVAWVEVADSYEGPYEFHGAALLGIGKHNLYTFPPDAQAEIAKRDARISRLENELADALDLKAGNGPTALAMQAARIKELEEEILLLESNGVMATVVSGQKETIEQQAAEISRLKALVGECEKKLRSIKTDVDSAPHIPISMTLNEIAFSVEEAIAAIKEEGL